MYVYSTNITHIANPNPNHNPNPNPNPNHNLSG